MTELPAKQVFHTSRTGRWKSFQWIFRALAVLVFLVIIGLVASLFNRSKVHVPGLINGIPVRLSIKEIAASVSPVISKEFTKDLDSIRRKRQHDFYEAKVIPPRKRLVKLPVRAGFYVTWDIQSAYSLQRHIAKLNMVLPEWLFVSDTGIDIEIDSAGINIMRKSQVAVVPMLSNYFKEEWNGENVHRILISEKERRKFIGKVLGILDRYHFQGINVDFEELSENTDEYLILFMKELSLALHAKGYLVTQDISPFNEDYNIRELAKYNDFIFLMGYDQHNANSLPGPIAAVQWVEQALEDICNKMDPDKVILCIPAFGYDWPVGYHGEDVTYEEAITTASDNQESIFYDNNNYNVHFTYNDDKNLKHEVWFADACTGFNLMRASEDFGTAGVAFWRLGSEDNRLWRIYNRRLSLDSLKEHPILLSKFERVTPSYNIDFIGAGEILNILSAPKDGRIKIEMDTAEQLIAEQHYISLPTSYVIEKTGESGKKIALTFDDGPDQRYTPQILDILKKYNVKATFFVVGINCEQNVPLVRRIYEQGHEIGNHTFTHPDLEESSDERVRMELRSTNLLISAITGHSTLLFRSPFNADAEPRSIFQVHSLKIARDEGFITVGSSIDPRDWEKGISVDTIYNRAVTQRTLGNILLLHDSGGDRSKTLIALPLIIEYYQKNGYKFVTVSEMMGRTRQDVMPPGRNDYLGIFDSWVIFGSYFGQLILFGLFFLALVLMLGKLMVNGVLATIQFRKERNEKAGQDETSGETGFVSIIVPAHNEEKTIVKTIANLLDTRYPAFEIIAVDDGSTDKTLALLNDRFAGDNRVKILAKPNGGKASALQAGIANASGKILVCIDADTMLDPEAVSRMSRYFADPEVAAVAGQVKVGNRVNLLTSWQSIEYITSQNFDRRAFDLLNAIMVVPGAIGAFRRKAVEKAGGFTSDTLAEDCDLTLRLIRCGYKIRNCSTAASYTEAPQTVRMFLRQRFRWTFGIMQSFWKHRELLFNRRKKNLGWVILPNILIFQMILPLFSPIVDLMMIFALFSPNQAQLWISYLIFLLIDAAVAGLAHYFDRERFGPVKLFYLIIQRFIYRQFLWYVLVKSYLRALKGELTQWGVLKRTGSVRVTRNVIYS